MHTLTLHTDFGDLATPESRERRRATDKAANPAATLDAMLPLRGASHADVISYTVEVPMRYAECLGILANGRRIPLLDKRQFKGWTDQGEKRTLLFEKGDLHLELQIDPAGSEANYRLRPIDAAFKLLNRCKDELRCFSKVDGDVFYLPSL